ncbi:MAG: glycosyltransferase family 8 protein [Lachnospiraceae bacterium]|nr:glycosyltransferase family 8 protein [Lachnospiraceae bacterium]
MQIKIAFCFDENLVNQILVAVASLLDFRDRQDVHYDIYCVCTGAAADVEPRLREVINARDKESVLTMKVVENPYENSYQVRGISTGTYLRLMLHRLLPAVDKILYTDVDVFFQKDLAEIWELSMDEYVLAAVKGAVNLSDKWEWNSDRPYWNHLENMKGRYINAGVAMMNLKQIREQQLERQWDKWAKEKLYYQDQDILNLTCQNAIRYLPPKYNMLAYMGSQDYDRFVSEGIFSEEECKEALKQPVIIHYAGDKPWKRYDTNLGKLWWDYVNSQPDLQGLFDEKKARSYHGPTFGERVVRKLRKMVSKEKL